MAVIPLDQLSTAIEEVQRFMNLSESIRSLCISAHMGDSVALNLNARTGELSGVAPTQKSQTKRTRKRFGAEQNVALSEDVRAACLAGDVNNQTYIRLAEKYNCSRACVRNRCRDFLATAPELNREQYRF